MVRDDQEGRAFPKNLKAWLTDREGLTANIEALSERSIGTCLLASMLTRFGDAGGGGS